MVGRRRRSLKGHRFQQMCIRDGDRGRDNALIRGARMTPAWRPNFFSGRIVVMVGVSLCKSSAARRIDASMLGLILARRQLRRASSLARVF
jgi:hypothetical protein